MPNEMDQLPRIPLAMLSAAPGRHSAQTNAVFDDVEQFFVCEFLGALLSHIRRMRVHPAAHLDLTASIVGMTECAVVGPMRHCFIQNFFGFGYWIWPVLRFSGHSHAACLFGGERL